MAANVIILYKDDRLDGIVLLAYSRHIEITHPNDIPRFSGLIANLATRLHCRLQAMPDMRRPGAGRLWPAPSDCCV